MDWKRLILVCVAFGAIGCAALNQTNPFSESHEWVGDGLPLLRKVSDRLHVGGQPSKEGLARLKGMGVKTVINVRESESAERRERKVCEELGMEYVALPVPCGGPMSDGTVEAFFGIVRDSKRSPVFLHCMTGRDRASTFAALYRVAEEGWTADQAYAEMLRCEFNAGLTDLSQYVYDFAKRKRTAQAPTDEGGIPSR
ncbi:MAG: protein tyrosine phosphatase family protein [Planctomycetota bacterium]